jgi:hypothetical protein
MALARLPSYLRHAFVQHTCMMMMIGSPVYTENRYWSRPRWPPRPVVRQIPHPMVSTPHLQLPSARLPCPNGGYWRPGALDRLQLNRRGNGSPPSPAMEHWLASSETLGQAHLCLLGPFRATRRTPEAVIFCLLCCYASRPFLIAFALLSVAGS